VHIELIIICTSHFGNKNANAPWAINRASQLQAQAELHGDLKRKLEFFVSQTTIFLHCYAMYFSL
jgi:hypothetical protein